MNVAATTIPTEIVTAPPTPGGQLDKTHAGLMKAAQGFESYFVDEMLKEMRKTVPKDELFGDGADEEDIFQDMSDQAVADSMAKTGSFGIANMLYSQLSKGLPPNDPDAASSTFAAASTGASDATNEMGDLAKIRRNTAKVAYRATR